MPTIKTFACCIALVVCCSVSEAQNILIDFDSAAVGDQARTVNGLDLFPSLEGSTTFGDSLIAPVGVGGSNGILYEDLDIHPGTSNVSRWRTSQSAGIQNAIDPTIEIGQMLSFSTDMRIENATTFDDNPYVGSSKIINLSVFSHSAAGFSSVLLILQRGRPQPGAVFSSDPQYYTFGIVANNYSQEVVATGDVADLGLVNNSPNEVSDFFNIEMVIKRNAADEFTVFGYLDDENGVNLQTISIGNLDFSNVFDAGGSSTYWYEVDNTAYAAHESLVFDNFRFSVSAAEPCPTRGDCNKDGVIDFSDIPPFIAILIAGDYLFDADVNEDGVVEFADIGPFITLLISQG